MSLPIDYIRPDKPGEAKFWCCGCTDDVAGQSYSISYADREYGMQLCRKCLTKLKRMVDKALGDD